MEITIRRYFIIRSQKHVSSPSSLAATLQRLCARPRPEKILQKSSTLSTSWRITMQTVKLTEVQTAIVWHHAETWRKMT